MESYEGKSGSGSPDASENPVEKKQVKGLFAALKINVANPMMSSTFWILNTIASKVAVGLHSSAVGLRLILDDTKKQYSSFGHVFGVIISAFGFALFEVSNDRSLWKLYTCVVNPLYYVVHKLSTCVLKYHSRLLVLEN